MMSAGPNERQSTSLVVKTSRIAGLGALFLCSAFFVGLIVACFVPPTWVISAEDAAFLRSNPHGVIDLSDDYQKLFDGRPMSAERNRQLHSHLRQLWFAYWLRWGAVSLLYGAMILLIDRSLGLRTAAIAVGLSAIGFVAFIIVYLLTHPGFNPFY